MVLDILGRQDADARNRVLIQELNHRVKNALASAQAIVSKTLRASDDLATARQAVEERLVALAGAHDLLAADLWRSVGLKEVVDSTVSTCRVKKGRFSALGTDIRLTPKTALAIAMALHELCSNAVKFGALSNETGAVSVTWHADGSGQDRHLRITWTERGGPSVLAPCKRGFGLRLIEWGLAAELGGKARLDFAPEGAVCHIDIPLFDSIIEVHA